MKERFYYLRDAANIVLDRLYVVIVGDVATRGWVAPTFVAPATVAPMFA